MDRKIVDLHMHVVPKIDDGAVDLSMSMEMLQSAYEQGVKHIFCTSHNVYEEEEIKRYQSQLMMLQMCARTRFPDLTLHQGCELLCAGEYIEDILYGLEIRVTISVRTLQTACSRSFALRTVTRLRKGKPLPCLSRTCSWSSSKKRRSTSTGIPFSIL